MNSVDEIVTEQAADARRWSEQLRSMALAIGGAVAYASAFPPVEFGAGAWLAAVLWLMLMRGRSARERFRWMFLSGLLGTALVVTWLMALFSIMALFLWMIPALYFGVWGLVGGLWQQARSGLVRVAWPGVTFLAMEYVRGELAPLAFTFGTVGSSQINMSGAWLAGWTGMYGVGGVVVVAAGAMVEAARGGTAGRAVAVVAGLGIVAMTMLPPVQRGGADRDALMTAALHQVEMSDAKRVPREMGDEATAPGVDLSVWPELLFQDDPRENRQIAEALGAEAALTSAGVIAGAIRYAEYSPDSSGGEYYNAAFYYDADGALVGTAAKNQPIPFFQDGLPAPGVSVLDVDLGAGLGVVRAGVGVCYDGSFQKYARRMTAAGAEVLIFPTMNMQHWGVRQHRQHQRLFQMRAAETGCSVLVAAVNGPTMAVLPGGAVVNQVEPGQPEVLRVQVAAPHDSAFMKGGWLVGPVSVGVAVAGLLWWLGAAVSGARGVEADRSERESSGGKLFP